VSPEGITTDSEMQRGVWEWPIPKNKHEIRSFLFLCTYYKQFISGFANIVKMLTPLAEEKQAFPSNTKGATRTVSVLAYPQPREMFAVDTEPSKVWIGGVPSQVQDLL
jgi:hypothetical protein